MSALFLVVPLALLVSSVAVGAFVWSVRRGQLDDLTTPALRMLEEESTPSADGASPVQEGTSARRIV